MLESAPGESWGVKFDPTSGSSHIAIGGGVSRAVHVYDVGEGEKKKSLELPETTADAAKTAPRRVWRTLRTVNASRAGSRTVPWRYLT